jgi:hypothetical protein
MRCLRLSDELLSMNSLINQVDSCYELQLIFEPTWCMCVDGLIPGLTRLPTSVHRLSSSLGISASIRVKTFYDNLKVQYQASYLPIGRSSVPENNRIEA